MTMTLLKLTAALGRQARSPLAARSALWKTAPLLASSSSFSSFRPTAAVFASVHFMSTVSIPEPPTSNHYHVPLANVTDTIVYTETDEAPALATYSLYPYIAKFAALSGIDVVPADISVAGRVLAAFPEKLKENQRVADNLAWLGEWAKTPEANIVKLPNISAPLNQMEDCIKELRSKGYDVPLYPREPSTQEEEDIKSRYDTLMGSAVSVPFTNYSFVVVCKTVGCIVFFFLSLLEIFFIHFIHFFR